MYNIFKKAVTVLGSVAMIGATVGVASASAFPEPFTSNTAIVVGSGAAASDSGSASTILTELNKAAASKSTSGDKTLTGDGDKYLVDKSSDHLNLGDTIAGIKSSLDDDELPELLAKGTYSDTNNDDFEFTQSIALGSALAFNMFSDSDYNDRYPTTGINISSGTTVLTYTLDFVEDPTLANMENTDLTIMGKDYYVLDAATTNDKLTLLDSAETTVLSEGDSKTVTIGGKSYDVSIEFISSSEVKLKINGEITKSIAEGGTYKLKNSEYVGVKDILYNSKDTGISKVEFSIGAGKLVLQTDQEVELNDDNIEGLTATITNSTTKLSKVILTWAPTDDLFVTEDSEIELPGFKTVKISTAGLKVPLEEKMEVSASSDDNIGLENFPLTGGVTYDIPLLYTDGTSYTGIGKSATDKTLTSGGNSVTFIDGTHDIFIASYSDGSVGESYIFKASGFSSTDGINKTDIQYLTDSGWEAAVSNAEVGEEFNVGSVELNITAINRVDKTVTIANNSIYTNFYTLYSEEGMKLWLPHTTTGLQGYINFTATPTTWNLQMQEEDKDEDVAGGDAFNITLGLNSQTPKEPEVSDIVGEEATFVEIEETDVYRSFMYSALATEFLWAKGGDQDYVTVVYHGEEVSADVYITAPDVGFSSGGETGIMSVKDTESDKYSGKNLVVIGGSAINTVAAELLGGAYRGPEFTTMTSVDAGGFLIQSFDRSGKTALLVAGYNAADTEKATTYLVNNQAKVDTTPGKKYTGTSATEATLYTA